MSATKPHSSGYLLYPSFEQRMPRGVLTVGGLTEPELCVRVLLFEPISRAVVAAAPRSFCLDGFEMFINDKKTGPS